MRRLPATGVLVLAAAVLLAGWSSARAQGAVEQGWVIERFDATIAVEADGTLRVTEQIDVDFRTVERRGIFRNLPVRYELSGYELAYELPEGLEPHDVYRVLDLDDLHVSSTAPDDMKVTSPGIGEHDLVLRIGDEDIFVTGRQSYVIGYTVRGALNSFADVDELRWNVTGDGWPVPIGAASATVRGPGIVQAACAEGRGGVGEPCARADHDGAQASFASNPLAPGAGLTVAVGFEPGAVEVAPPVLRPKWRLSRALHGSPFTLPLAGLTALLGFGGVGLLAYRQGRDRVARGGETVDGHLDDTDVVRRPLLRRRPVPVEYRPPDGLRPGQLGVLLDERVNPVDVSATVVDLAVRGHLRIEEETTRGLFRSRTDWRLQRLDSPDDELLGYERALAFGLFAGRREVMLSDLAGAFAEDYAAVESALYADAVKRKWFASRPDKVRSRWLLVGLLALVASVGLFAAAVAFTTFALALLPLVGASVALAVAHRWMPHRTPKGTALLKRTLGFREFIRTAEADRMRFAEDEHLFERYLPYAVVFGAVDRWAATFAQLGTTAAVGATGMTAWYVGSDPSLGLAGLSGGLNDFAHQITSSLPVAPARSLSGGGGGGGGGFGGSGGGFGGGGGGSW